MFGADEPGLLGYSHVFPFQVFPKEGVGEVFSDLSPIVGDGWDSGEFENRDGGAFQLMNGFSIRVKLAQDVIEGD